MKIIFFLFIFLFTGFRAFAVEQVDEVCDISTECNMIKSIRLNTFPSSKLIKANDVDEIFSEIVKNNPFTVQATRQPLYITLSFVILSVLLSFRIKVKSQYYSFSGLLLFMMIFIFFIISLLNYGLQNVIANSYFDISYFNMCMPFVIVSIGLMFFNNKRLKLWSL